MKLKPVFTEATMSEAKKGKFTFFVDPSMSKTDIKRVVGLAFDVHVVSVATINSRKSKKRSISGKISTIKARKKAILTVKKGQTIDIFEQKEEKKGNNTAKGRKKTK